MWHSCTLLDLSLGSRSLRYRAMASETVRFNALPGGSALSRSSSLRPQSSAAFLRLKVFDTSLWPGTLTWALYLSVLSALWRLEIETAIEFSGD